MNPTVKITMHQEDVIHGNHQNIRFGCNAFSTNALCSWKNEVHQSELRRTLPRRPFVYCQERFSLREFYRIKVSDAFSLIYDALRFMRRSYHYAGSISCEIARTILLSEAFDVFAFTNVIVFFGRICAIVVPN
jgi:hypothetical protein